ncbi:MAG TPA: thermonuclease family protein [Pseudolabrys sp.]|nr:thermonuclease family protein [Pseudolabrys sp.]
MIARAAAQTPGNAEAPACKLEGIGSATVASISDGRSFTLADGREVRLAGIELPARGAADSQAPAAKAALSALIASQTVNLKSRGQDRYGRIVAYAYLPRSDPPVQVALLAAGHALVGTNPGGAGCAEPLFTAERKARAARLGLWADPNFAPLQADDPGRVLAERGRFALVEGKVLSVREAGATIYVNFGRRWSRDFTVTILKRNRQMFLAAGIEPKALEGHRIRVRGIVERRGGPIVEARHPEQIELIDQ